MKLERKIHTTNEINRVGYETSRICLPQLSELIGVKLFLKDGSRSKKFNIDIPTIEPDSFNGEWVKNHGSYFDRVGRSLYLKIRLSFSDGHGGSIYEDKSIYVGGLGDDEQTLSDVVEEISSPKTFHVETVRILLEEKEELNKKIRQVDDLLGVFKNWW